MEEKLRHEKQMRLQDADTALANRIFMICYGSIIAVLELAYLVEVFKGLRTFGYYALFFSIGVIPFAVCLVMYRRRRDSAALRVVATVAYLGMCLFVMLTTTTVLGFVYILPFMTASAVFSSQRLVIGMGAAVMALNVVDLVYKGAVMPEFLPDSTTIEVRMAVLLLCCIFLVLATQGLEKISRRKLKESNESANIMNVVADIAEEIAVGGMDISAIEAIDLDSISRGETRRILLAFKNMVQSLAKNITVVKRVADGDLTAYVEIRSDEDALGKNLYRMVQNNDLMFAHVADVADSVTEQVRYIASANASLAEGCSKQAETVGDFVEKIDAVSNIILETAEKTDECTDLANTVKREVDISTEKMRELRDAMQQIEAVTARISEVITSIENIASQTNLLSLNASIEAARAGEAGRGFAVVAESIGSLAQESAELSQESKQLIEETTGSTAYGSRIANETFDAFATINSSINRIVSATGEIAERSSAQREYIEFLMRGTTEISDTVSENAAASQETASMSDEMIRNAEELKSGVSQYNLRQRTPGKPYIPPEKAGDKEFIAIATKNYEEYQRTHGGGF